jgi:hypothetical protein
MNQNIKNFNNYPQIVVYEMEIELTQNNKCRIVEKIQRLLLRNKGNMNYIRTVCYKHPAIHV